VTSSPTPAPIGLRTLIDGGQRPADVARDIAGFLAGARTFLDLALYDVRFETDAGALVLASLLAAVQRGVTVRLLYNVAHPGPIPVPPPPETAPEAIEALPVETRPIAGVPDLMHHKFVVRDREATWAGSTNWTDDSWSRQENVIVTVDSPAIAYAYTLAFEQLWKSGDVAHTGRVDPRPEVVGSARVRAWFCPEHGETLSPSRITYLWCRRSGTPAIAFEGAPKEAISVASGSAGGGTGIGSRWSRLYAMRTATPRPAASRIASPTTAAVSGARLKSYWARSRVC